MSWDTTPDNFIQRVCRDLFDWNAVLSAITHIVAELQRTRRWDSRSDYNQKMTESRRKWEWFSVRSEKSSFSIVGGKGGPNNPWAEWLFFSGVCWTDPHIIAYSQRIIIIGDEQQVPIRQTIYLLISSMVPTIVYTYNVCKPPTKP